MQFFAIICYKKITFYNTRKIRGTPKKFTTEIAMAGPAARCAKK
jgi:hypothetical protein